MAGNSATMRWLAITMTLAGLCLVFVLQGVDYLALIIGAEWARQYPDLTFVINRVVRLVLNDTLCLVLISNLFQRPDYVRIAWLVFLAELFILLPIYLLIKLTMEGPTEISSPLLQPIHRMIVNPLLMVILIGAFYYQQWVTKAR